MQYENTAQKLQPFITLTHLKFKPNRGTRSGGKLTKMGCFFLKINTQTYEIGKKSEPNINYTQITLNLSQNGSTQSG